MINILILTDNTSEWLDKFRCCMQTSQALKRNDGYRLVNSLFTIDIKNDINKNQRGAKYSLIIIDKPISSDYEDIAIRPLISNPIIHTKQYYTSD